MIYAKDGELFWQADLSNLTQAQFNFARELRYKFIFWEEVEKGLARLVKKESGTPASIRNVYQIIDYKALVAGVKVDKSARDLFDEQKALANAWEDEQASVHLAERELKEIIKDGLTKLQSGCWLCEHKKLVKGEYFCEYAMRPCRKKADEVEMEFEAWKEAKALNIPQEFYATPYPTIGCEYIIKARKAEEELQEMINKGGNENG